MTSPDSRKTRYKNEQKITSQGSWNLGSIQDIFLTWVLSWWGSNGSHCLPGITAWVFYHLNIL